MSDFNFFEKKINELTDSSVILNIDEWAEQIRDLPKELTPKPGLWSNEFAPFLVKIMRSLSPSSDTRFINVMKASQVCATTGLVENLIGFTVDEDPSGFLYVTADEDLMKASMDLKVDRMLTLSNISHKIKSSDEKNARKTGNTTFLKSFTGGFLLGVTAKSPNKARSFSVKKQARDEIDTYPKSHTKEGDTLKRLDDRSKAFETTKKILNISTPLLKETSLISPLYEAGDQQKYHVPCIHCEGLQELVFENLKFKVLEDDTLDYNSVCYQCKFCSKTMKNHHKTKFLDINVAKWVPTVKAKERYYESYHISALYSPVGLYSWESLAENYIKCWDVKEDRVKDLGKLMAFYNNDLGLPWSEQAETPKYEVVLRHKRTSYKSGIVPNELCKRDNKGEIIHFLTAACDVHKDNILMEVLGWTTKGRTYSIEYKKFTGDTELLENPIWEELAEFIETKRYKSDDKKQYKLEQTFIDAGYRTDVVHLFCGAYESGVTATLGRESTSAKATLNQFWKSQSKTGIEGLQLNTTLYKDRLAAALRTEWTANAKEQPFHYPNYPADYSKQYFKEYEGEKRVTKVDPKSNQILGYFWHRTTDNHSWDIRVYNMACYDFLVYKFCMTYFNVPEINYKEFWKHVISESPYFELL